MILPGKQIFSIYKVKKIVSQTMTLSIANDLFLILKFKNNLREIKLFKIKLLPKFFT